MNLIYFNTKRLALSYDDQQFVIRMAESGSMEKGDEQDLCSYVWELANKRTHEWVGNEKEATTEKLNLLLKKYIHHYAE